MKDAQLLLVAISESGLLFIQDDFNVLCYPGFVFWVTPHSPCWDISVHTGIYIISYALNEPVHVLTTWPTEHQIGVSSSHGGEVEKSCMCP